MISVCLKASQSFLKIPLPQNWFTNWVKIVSEFRWILKWMKQHLKFDMENVFKGRYKKHYISSIFFILGNYSVLIPIVQKCPPNSLVKC